MELHRQFLILSKDAYLNSLVKQYKRLYWICCYNNWENKYDQYTNSEKFLYIWSQAVIKWINNDPDKRYWPNKVRQSVPSGKVILSCWVEIRSLQKTETLNALIWNIASHYIPSITQNMTEKVTYAVINSIDYLPLIHTQFTPFSLVEHKRRPSQKIAENWLICNNLRILHCYKSCDPSCWKEAC